MTAALDGKSCIVTGAASGLGLATAKLMAAEGGRVVVADINEAGAHDAAEEIRAAGGTAVPCGVDVANEEQVREMVVCATREFGRLDVFYSNASWIPSDVAQTDGDITTLGMDMIRRTIDVDLVGMILGCKYAVPEMIAGGGGSIISTSAPSVDVGTYRFLTVHSATKAAIASVMRSVAVSFGKQNIRSNSVVPGMLLTPLAKRVMPVEKLERMLYHQCLPRFGMPEDMAELVVFLASDRASFITGQVIYADGGLIGHGADYADQLLAAGISPDGRSASSRADQPAEPKSPPVS